MPKSKRTRTVHLTQVPKKTREQKDKLFANIRETIPNHQYCLVLAIDNMRNTHLQELRKELSDSRLFFGKTKLMARALGLTPSEAQAEGLDRLAPHIHGTAGLLFTSRPPASVTSYLTSLCPVDFARAGTTAPRAVEIPTGKVYSTGGMIPEEYDVLASHTLEPELRRLGMPTRLVKGVVTLEGPEGYTVCKEGQTLDARQTRLLKLFGVCLSEFRVRVRAYWSAASGEVTVDEEDGLEAMEDDGGEE